MCYWSSALRRAPPLGQKDPHETHVDYQLCLILRASASMGCSNSVSRGRSSAGKPSCELLRQWAELALGSACGQLHW